MRLPPLQFMKTERVDAGTGYVKVKTPSGSQKLVINVVKVHENTTSEDAANKMELLDIGKLRKNVEESLSQLQKMA